MTTERTEIPAETEVLIVGAGPTGLTLANALAANGIDHVLVDRLEANQNSSRAAVVHAHTLEVLDRLDLAAPLIEAGLKLSYFRMRDRDSRLIDVRFDKLPTAHPYVLMIPQHQTERLLSEALMKRGGAIHRGAQVRRVAARGSGAEAEISVHDSMQTIRARYIVGADGMHSLVRQAAGIGFEGNERPESFMLADIEMDWPLGRDEVSLFYSPHGLAVVAPLPGNTFRIVATMETAPQEPTPEQVQVLLDARGPRQRGVVHRVIWGSRFHIHQRLAQSYRAGPFVLMGDAAHVHSPAGGQGMNTGLVDAVLLGEALVAARTVGDEALDRYAALRRPAAAEVLRLASRMTEAAVMTSPYRRGLRNLLLRSANTVPALSHAFAMNLSGLSRRSASQSDRLMPAGTRSEERARARDLPASIRNRAAPRAQLH